jgi:hypothetical protein
MPHKDSEISKKYFKKYYQMNKHKRDRKKLNEQQKEWRKNNVELNKSYRLKYYDTKKNTKYCKKRREIFYDYYKNYQKKHNSKEEVKLRKREYSLKKKYKITIKDYDLMYEKQEGKCAICKKHQTQLKEILNVDHDHKTGDVRGLLCNRCNVGLGYYEKSDINALENYLNKHRKDVN